jgi:parallel beta-helix repeat protein
VVDASSISGTNSNHTIFVPNNYDSGIYVCPNVITLADVNRSCSGRINFTYSEASTGTWKSGVYAVIDGNNYRLDNLTSSGSGEDTYNVSECQVLDEPNTTYIMNNSITPPGPGICINITAEKVTFDCDGYWISNTTLAKVGIYSNQFNTTIKNCNVTMNDTSGGYGIELVGANNCFIYNNTLNNQYYGLFLSSTHNTTIENNTANFNLMGIRLTTSKNNNLTNIVANNNTDDGVTLASSSDNNRLTNITTYDNTDDGVYLDNSDNNNLTNIMSYLNEDGIFLYDSVDNNLTNVTVSDNSDVGIVLATDSDNNTLTKITATSNQNGIHLETSSDNDLINIHSSSNSGIGIHLETSSNNILIDITANSNSNSGIYMNDNPSNNAIFNALMTDTPTGIRVDGTGNEIQFVTINGTTTDAIIILDSSVTAIINNTLITHCSGDGIDNSTAANGLDIDYIANYSCDHNDYSGANDVALSSDPYDPVPNNGDFYLLQNLEAVDAGSVAAANAIAPDNSFNLSTYYTTYTADTGTVDIGYHYPTAATTLVCGVLDQANTVYTQTANIVPPGPGTCINITAQNLTLDCDGYWISNTSLAKAGIYSNQFNTTITNCNVTMSSSSGGYGIWLDEANNSYVNNFPGERPLSRLHLVHRYRERYHERQLGIWNLSLLQFTEQPEQHYSSTSGRSD